MKIRTVIIEKIFVKDLNPEEKELLIRNGYEYVETDLSNEDIYEKQLN